MPLCTTVSTLHSHCILWCIHQRQLSSLYTFHSYNCHWSTTLQRFSYHKCVKYSSGRFTTDIIQWASAPTKALNLQPPLKAQFPCQHTLHCHSLTQGDLPTRPDQNGPKSQTTASVHWWPTRTGKHRRRTQTANADGQPMTDTDAHTRQAAVPSHHHKRDTLIPVEQNRK